MKREQFHLLAAVLAASLSLPALAPAVHAAGPADPAGAFNRLKQLEGEWQGKTESGTPIVLRYHVQAGGTTLMETQAPGTPEEMVSIYSITGNDLVMTHYCPMGAHGNQPHFRLDLASPKPDTLEFVFTGGENLDPAKDTHVHGGRFIFLPDGRLERDWSINAHGKPAGNERFVLSRKPS
jgi:hypothetical protein